MKPVKHILLVVLIFLTSVFAGAKEILVCKSISDSSHTVVIQSEVVGRFSMVVYRVRYGHAFPPDRKDVIRDGASVSGHIIFSDLSGRAKLDYQPSNLTTKGEFLGEFVDSSVNPTPLAVACVPQQ